MGYTAIARHATSLGNFIDSVLGVTYSTDNSMSVGSSNCISFNMGVGLGVVVGIGMDSGAVILFGAKDGVDSSRSNSMGSNSGNRLGSSSVNSGNSSVDNGMGSDSNNIASSGIEVGVDDNPGERLVCLSI